MGIGKHFVYFNALQWRTNGKAWNEIQAYLRAFHGHVFLSYGTWSWQNWIFVFFVSWRNKKNKIQWSANANLDVAQGTMPKQKPSVLQWCALHLENPPNAGHQCWECVDPLGAAAAAALLRACWQHSKSLLRQSMVGGHRGFALSLPLIALSGALASC